MTYSASDILGEVTAVVSGVMDDFSALRVATDEH